MRFLNGSAKSSNLSESINKIKLTKCSQWFVDSFTIITTNRDSRDSNQIASMM